MLPLCFRSLETLSKVIYNDEYASIVHETDCVKPCKYRKYKLLGNKKEASFVTSKALISLWAVSNNTWVETEVLLYPMASLVAEFGGTLGLFLGFSFMAVWDGLLVCNKLIR